MNKLINFLLIFSVLVLFSPANFAAQAVNVRYQSDISQQSIDPSSSSSSKLLIALPPHLAVQNTTLLKQESKEMDVHGNTHIREQQIYLGYSVYGAEEYTHISPSGKITKNGTIYENLSADLKGAPQHIFTKAQADLALNNAISYYAKKLGKTHTPTHQESQLMVYVDSDHKAHWVFKVGFYIKTEHEAPVNPGYLLDAMSFKIYKEWDDIEYLEKTKSGGLGGNLKIGMITYDGLPNNKPSLDVVRDGTQSACYLQNDRVTVKDGMSTKYKEDPDGINFAVLSFKCDQLDPAHGNIYWHGALGQTNGAWSPGTDALYLAEKVSQMYEDWFQIPVLADKNDKNKPAMLNLVVHDNQIRISGLSLYFGGMNACWDPKTQQLRFGDGVGLFGPLDDMFPFVVSDIVAHELSHAFTHQHAKFYARGVSGALSESFSDIAAKAFEYYSKGKVTWTIAEEQSKTDRALRYMDEPTLDCRFDKTCSIDNAKNYKEGINSHYSSGVFNKAYYLLSTASGWNPRKAFEVMVQANRYHWTSTLDFQEASCGVWDAAQDLNLSSNDLSVISKAMAGVGLETNENKCHPYKQYLPQVIKNVIDGKYTNHAAQPSFWAKLTTWFRSWF